MSDQMFSIDNAPRVIPAQTFLKPGFLLARKYTPLAAKKHGLSEALILSVIFHESRFNQYDRSKCGACGFMQLLEKYFLAKAKAAGKSIFDADFNIDEGTRFLAANIKEWGDEEQGLSAYNMGAGNLKLWLNGDEKTLIRFGRGKSPTGKTPRWQWEKYQGKILEDVPRFKELIK
jgi:soluble lytic murein transglycosylase-like protein